MTRNGFHRSREERIKGRVAAARSEGTHPSAALVTGKAPAKARKD